jgi:SAM-dependent methyltransferase
MTLDNLYSDAALYDLVHLGPWKGELEFYLRAAGGERDRRVLELACGTGRLTIPLAERGLDMTGLDLSPAMLERARAKADQAGVEARFIQGDMRAFDLAQRFDLIFIPINSICHLLSRPDVEACLGCVRAHLAPAGRLVIDVFNPSLAILMRESGRWFEVGVYDDEQGRPVRLTEQNRYDRATQINHILWRFEGESGRAVERRLTMKQYFPQELDALLACNGFAIEAKWGQYGGQPFHSDSNQQVVVARLA